MATGGWATPQRNYKRVGNQRARVTPPRTPMCAARKAGSDACCRKEKFTAIIDCVTRNKIRDGGAAFDDRLP
eukprot:scaffold292529_cov31-Tisochrysis_lutea.AAC.5